MSILIFAVIVILLLALAVYGIQNLPLQAPFGNILIVLAVLIAIIAIAQRAGMF